MTLLDETIELGRRTQLSVDAICTAAEIKERWYRRLLAGDFTDPGVNKVERLHRVLSAAERPRGERRRAA